MASAVAVDGPAAAGKGTLARGLAHALGLSHLDTGLLYRAVGVKAAGLVTSGDAAAMAVRVARGLSIVDLARDDLRSSEADRLAALVAANPAVRAALLRFQRDFAAKGAVLDGRDIGTVVLPNARVKLFVTASLNERALRRWKELTARGAVAELEQVRSELAARDARDEGRAIAPLRPAEDAMVLDTTTLDADAALSAALSLVLPRLSA